MCVINKYSFLVCAQELLNHNLQGRNKGIYLKQTPSIESKDLMSFGNINQG